MMQWKTGRRAVLIMAAASMLAAGCGGMGPDSASEDLAKQAYLHLVRKEDAALNAMMVPAFQSPDNGQVFDRMRAALPPGPLLGVTRTSWKANAGTDGRQATFEHTYDYGPWVVLATTVMVGSGDTWRVQSLNVKGSAAPAK